MYTYIFLLRIAYAQMGSMLSLGFDNVPCILVDPYTSLAHRHKLDYSYSFALCPLTNEEYIVREIPSNKFKKKPDPLYIPLNSQDWIGEEYTIDDVYPPKSIMTPKSLQKSRKLKGYSWDDVSTDDFVLTRLSEVRLSSKRQSIQVPNKRCRAE